jgi:uncharacterized protein
MIHNSTSVSDLAVRPVKPADLPEVLKINQTFVPRVSSIDLQWLEHYAAKARSFYVAELDGKVVGYLIAMDPQTDYASENFRWFKTRYDDFLYIDRVAIHQDYQGLGIGQALYLSLEEHAAGGFSSLACEVNIRPENPQSMGFHLNYGFKEVGQQDTKGGAIRVSMLMKSLAKLG